MTDPQIGPQGAGSSGDSAEPDAGAGRGPGSAGRARPGPGASAATTAPSSSAPRAAVPPQYEPGQQYADYRYAAEPGIGPEDTAGVRGNPVLAAAARQSWPAVLAGGLGLIALGVMLLVWPHATLTVVAILVGAALVVSGLVRLVEGFTASSATGGTRAAYVVIGLLAVLAGLYCLRDHALSLFLVSFVTGVYFVVHGVSDLGVAMSAEVPGRVLRAVLGVCSIAAGIILVVWPGVTLVLLVTIIGAWLIFYGIVLASLAVGLRRVGRTAATRPGPPGRPVAGTPA